MNDPAPVWHVYIVRCSDRSLYTGIATDVARRVQEHLSSPRGARYLRGRGPLKVEFAQAVGTRSEASKVESRIKALSRAAKERLLLSPSQLEALVLEFTAPAE